MILAEDKKLYFVFQVIKEGQELHYPHKPYITIFRFFILTKILLLLSDHLYN
jgi:hypothetical protein